MKVTPSFENICWIGMGFMKVHTDCLVMFGSTVSRNFASRRTDLERVVY